MPLLGCASTASLTSAATSSAKYPKARGMNTMRLPNSVGLHSLIDTTFRGSHSQILDASSEATSDSGMRICLR